MMTENDRMLIMMADETPASDWSIIDQYAEEADSQDTKEYLREMAKRKYHEEEADADLL